MFVECPRFQPVRLVPKVLSVNTLAEEKQNAVEHNEMFKTCINKLDVEKSACKIPDCSPKTLEAYVEYDFHCCPEREINTFTVSKMAPNQNRERPTSFIRKRKLTNASLESSNEYEINPDQNRPASFIRKRKQNRESMNMSYPFQESPTTTYNCQTISQSPDTSETRPETPQSKLSSSSRIQFSEDVEYQCEPDIKPVKSKKSIIKNMENSQDVNKSEKNCALESDNFKSCDPCALCNRVSEDIETVCDTCKMLVQKLKILNETKEESLETTSSFVTTCSICKMIYESSSFCEVCCHCKNTLEDLGEKPEKTKPAIKDKPCYPCKMRKTVEKIKDSKTRFSEKKENACECKTPKVANREEKKETPKTICAPCGRQPRKAETELCYPCDIETIKTCVAPEQMDKPKTNQEKRKEKNETQICCCENNVKQMAKDDCKIKCEKVGNSQLCCLCPLEIHKLKPKTKEEKIAPRKEKTFYECGCYEEIKPSLVSVKQEKVETCVCGTQIDNSTQHCADCGSTFQIDDNPNLCESCKIRFIFKKLGILKNEQDAMADCISAVTSRYCKGRILGQTIETQTSKYPINTKKCKCCNLFFEINLAEDLCVPCRVKCANKTGNKAAKQTRAQHEDIDCDCDSESELICECSGSEPSIGNSCTCIKDEDDSYNCTGETQKYSESLRKVKQCLEQSTRLTQCINTCKGNYTNYIRQNRNHAQPDPFVCRTIPCQFNNDTKEFRPRPDCVEIIKSQLKYANDQSMCTTPSNKSRNFCCQNLEGLPKPSRSNHKYCSRTGRIAKLTTQLPQSTVCPDAVVFRKSCKNLSGASSASTISYEEESEK